MPCKLADHFWHCRERKKARSDFLSGRGMLDEERTREESLADAERKSLETWETARWHFVAAALTFEPFYPDLRFLGSLRSGRSGSRNRYYPPLLHQIEILPCAPQHLTLHKFGDHAINIHSKWDAFQPCLVNGVKGPPWNTEGYVVRCSGGFGIFYPFVIFHGQKYFLSARAINQNRF